MLTATLLAPTAALGCGLMYLAVDYLRKVVDAPPLQIVFVFIALQIPVLAAAAWLSGDFTDASVSRGYWLPGLADVAAGIAANVLYLLALRRSPFSLMVPVLALIPGVTLLLSGALLGEWPTGRQTAGILIVVAGLFTLYSAAGATGGVFSAVMSAAQNLRRESGARLMAGVVVLWSTTPALDKLSVAQSSVSLHGLIQVSVISALLALWIALRHGFGAFRIARSARGPLLAAGILGGAGYILQLAAYQMILVAAVELIRRMSGMLGALMVGRLALNEPLSPAKVAGVLIIALGLPLVLWP